MSLGYCLKGQLHDHYSRTVCSALNVPLSTFFSQPLELHKTVLFHSLFLPRYVLSLYEQPEFFPSISKSVTYRFRYCKFFSRTHSAFRYELHYTYIHTTTSESLLESNSLVRASFSGVVFSWFNCRSYWRSWWSEHKALTSSCASCVVCRYDCSRGFISDCTGA